MKSLTILGYQWKDLLRGKWIIGYSLIFLLLTDGLIRFGGGGPRAMLSIANVMLLFIPLVSMVFGVLFLYQSREFIELLLSQPLKRKTLFWGLYGGLAIPLAGAYLVGVGLPMSYFGLIFTSDFSGIMLVMALGTILTLIFVGIGFLFGLHFYDNRVKGLGYTLIVWLLLAVLYDGIILMVVSLFGDYPLEKVILGLSMINPIDLSRIVVLLEYQISALMGYTGAVFNRFFGSLLGVIIAAACLGLWVSLPAWRGMKLFNKKDF